jgi:FkbH-like protein
MSSTVHLLEDLNGLSDRLLSAPKCQRSVLTKQLVKTLREGISLGYYEEAASVLRRAVSPGLDYTNCQAFTRLLKQLQGKILPCKHRVKIAVLGGFTTKQITAFLNLHLFAIGIEAEIYESDYGVFRQEILDPASAMYNFAPQVVWLAIGRRDLGRRPSFADSDESVQNVVQAEKAEWSGLWETLHDKAGCQIIQNNFVLPAWHTFGNYEMRVAGGLSCYLAELNRTLLKSAPAFVTIHDADHLAASAGRWNWDDARFIHHAKMPCAPECIPDYAHNIASLIAVQQGLAKKCVVLDLDNTLWGGVVGDDGLGGVRLGQGSAEGEAFLAFQEYLKALRGRGILLAVCSKNNEATARQVFEQHPEMVLRLDDISCFVANWNDKPGNIRTIASELNIGLNSLVFVDDNPAERAIVRQMIPEVAVPEMPEDITAYVQAIDQHRYFQTISIATEDFHRTEFYRADAMRRAAQTSVADMDSFLKSLKMVAQIQTVNAMSLERTVQLVQRSNQFNLTTRRYSAADVLRFTNDPSWLTATVSLADRFGDNGLISVVFAQSLEQALYIDTWLMSCRVLKRGVEHCLLNHLCTMAKDRGLLRIRGEYLPTPKNDLVREHYSGLGFAKVSGDVSGRTVWELDLNCWQPVEHFIAVTATSK